MARAHGRRRRRGSAAHEESGERWLLTYADMITLLMALFMVLFSISSVNISKFQALQKSLKAGFSANILPGGKALAHPGATSNSSRMPTSLDFPEIVSLTPKVTSSSQASTSSESSESAAASTAAASTVSQQVGSAEQEANEFAHIKRELDTYANTHGFGSRVQTSIERRGLVIRVLTDDLLFPSGQATLNSQATALLGEISQLLNIDQAHPIDVEGNTDNVPIHDSQFPSNWELSAARASSVVEFLIEHGVGASRLTAAGNADERPVASNATTVGRAHNRRVEIVMRRIYGAEGESQPAGEP